MPFNHEACRREAPVLRAALTRAMKTRSSVKVEQACEGALVAWRRWGGWPDDWADWERAYQDFVNPTGVLDDLSDAL